MHKVAHATKGATKHKRAVRVNVTASPLLPVMTGIDDPLQYHDLRFPELDAETLLALLTLRQEVFLIEQNSLYRDLDGEDPRAVHVFGYVGKVLAAYGRLLPPEAASAPVVIGRLVLHPDIRGRGEGRHLLDRALAWAEAHYPTHDVRLSAQSSLCHWYTQSGFVARGEPYDDGGILHTTMVLVRRR